jgi:hypothetical protein
MEPGYKASTERDMRNPALPSHKFKYLFEREGLAGGNKYFYLYSIASVSSNKGVKSSKEGRHSSCKEKEPGKERFFNYLSAAGGPVLSRSNFFCSKAVLSGFFLLYHWQTKSGAIRGMSFYRLLQENILLKPKGGHVDLVKVAEVAFFRTFLSLFMNYYAVGNY